ncbi:hypothetical protein ACSS6W_000958 [Trichoderma asperelloides]
MAKVWPSPCSWQGDFSAQIREMTSFGLFCLPNCPVFIMPEMHPGVSQMFDSLFELVIGSKKGKHEAAL